ncbi:MAG: hypothetical protein ACE5GC_00190 [Acidimicrobiia bacterium]
MTGGRKRRIWLLLIAASLIAAIVAGVGGLTREDDGATSSAVLCRRLDAAMNEGATLASLMDLVTDELELPGNVDLMTNVAADCPETHRRFVNYHHGG